MNASYILYAESLYELLDSKSHLLPTSIMTASWCATFKNASNRLLR